MYWRQACLELAGKVYHKLRDERNAAYNEAREYMRECGIDSDKKVWTGLETWPNLENNAEIKIPSLDS